MVNTGFTGGIRVGGANGGVILNCASGDKGFHIVHISGSLRI